MKKARAKTFTVGEFSFGNKKLPETTGIFNFTSYKACPSRLLGLCKHADVCYTNKAERLYPQVLPFRMRQMDYWKNISFDMFVADFLTCSRIVERQSKKMVDTLRFSEAGDFPSQEDVDKFTKAASALKKRGIRVYGYTARKDLDFSRLMKVAVVQGSGFMLSNNFTLVEVPSGKHAVCAGDCRICQLCMKASKKVIEVVKH